MLLALLDSADRSYPLYSFEQVKGLHLEVDPFPEEVLTPTFKVKR